MEPWEEQVAQTLVTRLSTFEGGSGHSVGADGYWYRPDIVERVRAIDGTAVFNEQFETIYVLAPVSVTSVESTTREVEKVLTIDFLLARKHLLPDEPYHAKAPLPWTVQNRLWHDLERRILADVTLGGLTTNVNFSEVVFAAESTYRVGWAVVIGQLLPTDIREIEEEE
jgi:hypothetical protein